MNAQELEAAKLEAASERTEQSDGSQQRVVSTPIQIRIGAFSMTWTDASMTAADELYHFVIPWIIKHHEIKDGKVC